MPAEHTYDYAIIRVIPRVDRGECINAGVILSCPSLDFLEARIELDDVRVGPDALLGDAGKGAHILEWISERATTALCCIALGVTEQALAMTADYTKNRKQFDQPIAMFQAVGQRLADAYVDVEAARAHLEMIPRVCRGGGDAGELGALPQRSRFHWLVSPRSTIIQMSPVHTGRTDDPAKALERLLDTVVR